MVPAITRSARPRSVPEGLSVIVADGSPYARAAVAEALKRAGVDGPRLTADGAEAVGSIGTSAPDLLLLDWDLAVIPAPEVLRLARDAAGRDIPVIVTMASPRRRNVEAAMAGGVSCVLGKPLSIARLVERIEGAFAAR